MEHKIILCDTRQKKDKNRYIDEQLEHLGYKVDRCKLYTGDYTWATNQSICVDTKANMGEIESNLIQDHERFREECIRAKEAGIQLVILIQDNCITKLSDVFAWTSPRMFYTRGKIKPVNGRTLGKIMISMEQKYGVKFEFCTKNEVGQRIVKLLGGEI